MMNNVESTAPTIMDNLTNHESNVKQVIENLIQKASYYDIEALDQIYHNNMQVVMVDPSGQVHTADKTEFKKIFQARKAEGAPMNTWAQFHYVRADAQNGQVVLSRKNNLAGQDMFLNLSIDLKYESERWQVIREVIFIQSETH